MNEECLLFQFSQHSFFFKIIFATRLTNIRLLNSLNFRGKLISQKKLRITFQVGNFFFFCRIIRIIYRSFSSQPLFLSVSYLCQYSHLFSLAHSWCIHISYFQVSPPFVFSRRLVVYLLSGVGLSFKIRCHAFFNPFSSLPKFRT